MEIGFAGFDEAFKGLTAEILKNEDRCIFEMGYVANIDDAAALCRFCNFIFVLQLGNIQKAWVRVLEKFENHRQAVSRAIALVNIGFSSLVDFFRNCVVRYDHHSIRLLSMVAERIKNSGIK